MKNKKRLTIEDFKSGNKLQLVSELALNMRNKSNEKKSFLKEAKDIVDKAEVRVLYTEVQLTWDDEQVEFKSKSTNLKKNKQKMQKNQVSQEDISLLESYNDFIEALEESGINPFKIEQSKRIQAFIEAIGLFNKEQEEEPVDMVINIDANIIKFFIQLGVIKEMENLISLALNSMSTNQEKKALAERIEECNNPISLISTIKNSTSTSRPEKLMIEKELSAMLVKVQGGIISKDN